MHPQRSTSIQSIIDLISIVNLLSISGPHVTTTQRLKTMSAAEDPEGREHVGDEYVTYNGRKERRPRPDLPRFPPSLEEEEGAHREAKRRVEHEAEHEAEMMLSYRYERAEGNGKAHMEPEASFMQVLNNLVVSQ
jgi:hypothetical protein